MRRIARYCFLALVGATIFPDIGKTSAFLDPAEAFQVSARALDGHTLALRFSIAPGYYLYRDRFRFKAENIELGTPAIPRGKNKDDENFGLVEVFYDTVDVALPVTRNASGVLRFTLEVTSQGCAEEGLCYLPQTTRLAVHLPGEDFPEKIAEEIRAADSAEKSVSALSEQDILDESGFFARLLREENEERFFLGKLALFFFAGLGLSFTPCVLPMLPILSSVIVGQGANISRRRAFGLSLSYVLGMAITYAVLGVAAALSGEMLSQTLQTPWALFSFAAIFVLLALAMFGFYALQLPPALQNRLAERSRRLQGGRFFAVFVMGALSSLIIGPCVAAPLSGILLYIGQSGNAVLGGVALFALSIGMGTPLMLFGVSAGAFLPRAGMWMQSVQRFFGFLLLAAAVWIVSPVIPDEAALAAWAFLALLAAVALKALERLPSGAGKMAYAGKSLGILFLLYGIALAAGSFSGARDPLAPLETLAARRENERGTKHNFPPFERVANMEALDARLASAAQNHQPVLLDFYADWCVSCKEMERFTFSDPEVAARLQVFVRLQADVTDNTEADRQLLRRFSLYGPPGIVFFDRDGQEIEGLRVIGFQKAAVFLRVLNAADER
ncbi:MAG: protein-disulfide reductase DsbD [Zoogloeaceae bacterium]|nr:protein-disulfide reductase DsbD [Zoogloeaceae bacterium]